MSNRINIQKNYVHTLAHPVLNGAQRNWFVSPYYVSELIITGVTMMVIDICTVFYGTMGNLGTFWKIHSTLYKVRVFIKCFECRINRRTHKVQWDEEFMETFNTITKMNQLSCLCLIHYLVYKYVPRSCDRHMQFFNVVRHLITLVFYVQMHI